MYPGIDSHVFPSAGSSWGIKLNQFAKARQRESQNAGYAKCCISYPRPAESKEDKDDAEDGGESKQTEMPQRFADKDR